MKNTGRNRCFGVLAGALVAATGVLAGPASAAPTAGPATATTDAGTVCTVDAGALNRGGLLVKKIDFSGDVTCTPADAANPVSSSSSLILQSTAPLGIGQKSGSPRDPAAQEVVPPPTPPPGAPQEQGPSFRCDVEPGVDCGFSGRSDLTLSGQTYTALFGTALVAPEGERWVSVTEGCEIFSEDVTTVACASQEPIAVR